MTWYLCAHTRRSSEESRRIQFDTEQHMWLQDLQQLWRDQWIPHLDAQIYVIEPMPPKATYERHVGGLLIAQGEVPQHVPVLVTTIFASTLGRRLSHMACFLPQPCLPSQLFQMLRIERICHDRACRVEIAGQEVPMQGLAHAAAGDNVRVHVSARTHPGVSLLQTKAQRRFAFNPDAPVFEPTSHHPWERLTTDAVAHAQWPQVVQQTERSDSDVQHLCLNDLIPAPTIVQLDFHPVIALRDTILHLDLGNIHPRASIVKWHPSTQGAFDAIPDWQGELPTGVSFFTDGSAAWTQDERCASAAIIRIVHTAQGDRFGGFRCFTTLADGHAPYAEAAAIFAATLWTVQMCEAFPTSSTWLIQFHFDCMFAGMAAKAWWSVRAHAQLQQFTRSLVHWLEARYAIHIGWYHVPAHTGHPWNEAADAAAWAAVSQWIPCDDIAVLLHQLGGEHSMMAWLWLLEHAEHGHPAFPAVHRGIMNVNVSMVLQSQPTPDDHPFQACREHQPAASHEISFTLTCATANVLTLYQNKAEHGKGLTARLEALLRSFEHENILVIGVQETRSQMQGHTICHDFHVLAASATPKGVGGVQLWIKRKWKTSQGTITISTADLRIVAAEPQFLLVKLMHDGLRLLFLVGHAPNCPTFETATTFWNNISRSIPASLRSWSLIGLLDANARVGSMQSKAIGFCGEEPENLAGECFHQWLHDQNLFLPQTFDAYHRGDHTTWTHSSGATARLDFVALDQNLRQDGIQTCISNVDLTLHHEDHRSIQVAIPIQCRVKQFSRPTATSFHSTCAPPATPWPCDVHSHAAALQHWMHQTQPPRVAARCRKHHLQTETWNLIQSKRFHWNRLRQLRRTWRQGVLREVFAAWHLKKTPDEVSQLRPWLRLTDHAVALHSWQYQRLCSTVTHAVRQDDKAFYAALAAEQGDIAADEGLSGLWRKIKHLLPKGVARRKANIRCVGPQVDDLTAHYSQLEAGQEIEYADLLSQRAHRQREAQTDLPLQLKLTDLPTRVEIEQVCKLAKRRKAPGLDGVQAEHLQALMVHHSDVFFQLLFKIWTASAEPLQFKGGFICSIAKKQGSLTAAGMRGIMLLDVLGKLHHSLLRRRLLPWAAQNRLDTQFGGFQGQQTIFASLLLRSYAKVVEAKQVSLAIVFVDVKNAFHCLLRQHAFATAAHFPLKLQQVLTEEGLDVDQLTADIGPHACAFEQAPPTVARLIKDAHCNTWFTCPGSTKCFETTRGSRPGSPIADLAYNVMMSSLLKELQMALHQLPLLQQANCFLECPSPTVAWVDDIALPLPCLQASDLDALLESAMSEIHRVFRGYGLRLNCTAGKTEAIVQYRGTGAPERRKARFIDGYGRLDIPGHDPLHIVTHYTHLGIVVAQSCDLRQDLRVKVGKASAAYRSMNKTIFLNRCLGIPLRLKLLDALVLPIIFYGSGSWPLLSARQFQFLASTITKWQRQIAGKGFWKEDNVTDAEFRACWRIPPLAVRLAKHRLLFLLQLHRCGPQVVWDLVTAEESFCRSSWFDAVRQALTWLSTMIPDFPILEWTSEEILRWVHEASPQTPNQIRRAVARFLTVILRGCVRSMEFNLMAPLTHRHRSRLSTFFSVLHVPRCFPRYRG